VVIPAAVVDRVDVRAGCKFGSGIETNVMLRWKMCFVVVIKVENFLGIRSRTDKNGAARRTSAALEAVLFDHDVVRESVPKDAWYRLHVERRI
jgi:hypothetical protein